MKCNVQIQQRLKHANSILGKVILSFYMVVVNIILFPELYKLNIIFY